MAYNPELFLALAVMGAVTGGQLHWATDPQANKEVPTVPTNVFGTSF